MQISEDRIRKLKEKAIKLRNSVDLAASSTGSLEFQTQLVALCRQKTQFQLEISIRDHILRVDEPESSGGDNTAASPFDTLLTAFAGCIQMNWLIYSSIHQVSLQNVETEITGTIDRRYPLGTVPARLLAVRIISRLYTAEKPEKFDRIFEKVKQFCIVGNSLHPDIEKEYILEFHPPQ